MSPVTFCPHASHDFPLRINQKSYQIFSTPKSASRKA